MYFLAFQCWGQYHYETRKTDKEGICWIFSRFPLSSNIATFAWKVRWLFIFFSFIGLASARSYKIGVVGKIGWLFGWLVTQFSQKQLKGFFCFLAWSKRTIKVEKWQSRIFEKNYRLGDIREKVSKLAQNQILWYFSQKRL